MIFKYFKIRNFWLPKTTEPKREARLEPVHVRVVLDQIVRCLVAADEAEAVDLTGLHDRVAGGAPGPRDEVDHTCK